MNSLRPAGVDVTKKAGILVPLVDIEASLVVRVRRSSVRVRRNSEGCDVAQSGRDATQMVGRQAFQSSISGSVFQGGFSH
jgi:hypothetical protein